MKFPPFFLSTAAALGLAMPALSQSAIPAPAASASDYRVQVAWQKAVSGAGGLVIRGRVTNTGGKPLIYTQVETALCDGAGKTISKAPGYLTISPLEPGQSAEFRAFAPDAPAFRRLHMEFHESGRLVTVDEAQRGKTP